MQTEDVSKRPSFISKWISGGIPGMFADVVSSPVDATPTKDENTADDDDRAKLVKELTHQLEQESSCNEEAKFTLSASELRLLLGIPPPESQSKSALEPELSVDPSTFVSSWDLTSFFDDDLKPEEVQAIMIALAAEEDDNRATGTARPSPVASRQVTLQSLSSGVDEELEYLITLLGDDLDTPPKRPSQIATRQVSIQPEEASALKRPSLEGRQASVRPVANVTNPQFVVTIPAKEKSNPGDEVQRKPTTDVRQLSIQPAPIPDSELEAFRTPCPTGNGATWTPGMRNMAVSFNGGNNNLSFQVVL